MADIPSLDDLQTKGKPALARALAALETHQDDPALTALLDAAYFAPRGHVVGLTGPPGVGKSSLISQLVGLWRADAKSVGVIAVDPSSRRTGGALLGDRTRIRTDPEDRLVFIRSMAARDRLGGLAAQTVAAMVLMRSVFDRVIVETVGVGQSETDVADVADTLLFCVQPGSGDSLQFMKAGIMEVPDIVAVTKADLGPPADRARADVEGALGLTTEEGAARGQGGWAVRVLTVSSETGSGLDDLLAAVEDHASKSSASGVRETHRAAQAEAWLKAAVRERFGRDGVFRAERKPEGLRLPQGHSPFSREAELSESLAAARG